MDLGAKFSHLARQEKFLSLEHRDDVLAERAHRAEERSLRVQPVPRDHVEGAGEMLMDPPDEPRGRRHLVLPGLLGLDVDPDRDVLSDEHPADVAMVVLLALRPADVDVSHEAPRAAALVARRRLVPVHHQRDQAVEGRRHRFRRLLRPVEVVEHLAEIVRIDAGHHAPQRVGAGQPAPEPTRPERARASLGEPVEASDPTEEHQEERVEHGARRNLRSRAAVLDL